MKRTVRAIPVIAALALASAACAKKEAPPPPPPEVKVAPVVQRDVPVYIEVIGQTRGSTEIEVRARVEGFLESVNYREGTLRHARASSCTPSIRAPSRPARPRPGAWRRRRKRSSRGPGRTWRATSRWWPRTRSRARTTRPRSSCSGRRKPTLEAAKASRTGSDVDLSFTRVIAPASGLAGKTEVYPGTLVGRGQSTLLTRISQVDNIHVRVNIPERDFMEYQRRGEERRKAGNAGSAQVRAGPLRRIGPPAQGRPRLRGPRGGSPDGDDPGGDRLPEPRRHRPARPVRPRPCRHRREEERDPRPPARGHGDAGRLQRGRGEAGRHHRPPHGQGRRAHRERLGHRRRAEGGREDRGGRACRRSAREPR